MSDLFITGNKTIIKKVDRVKRVVNGVNIACKDGTCIIISQDTIQEIQKVAGIFSIGINNKL